MRDRFVFMSREEATISASARDCTAASNAASNSLADRDAPRRLLHERDDVTTERDDDIRARFVGKRLASLMTKEVPGSSPGRGARKFKRLRRKA